MSETTSDDERQFAEDNLVLDIPPISVSEPMVVISQAELAALRAQVAEQQQWRERAEAVLREVAQVQEDVVTQGRDIAVALDLLDQVIDDLAPSAYALLGEGGQG